jgi:phenylalanyl-tRNA synthetase alpha chain
MVNEMKERLEKIRNDINEKLGNVGDLRMLDEVRVAFLGKKGELTEILKGMGRLSQEERPAVGALANEAREYIEGRLDERRISLHNKAIAERIAAEGIDVTMPGKRRALGRKHPMTSVIDEITRLFVGMGYSVAEGPEIETVENNFDKLNAPANHPSRDTQDTFYTEGGFLLRTQTSPVQVRVMSVTKPPIRVICPGKVYRADEIDATHSPVFHQVEGLVVDKGITMGDLKGALNLFARVLLGGNTKTRFRPHYFPFTEPSAEMDVSCFACGGGGCRVCKDEGWIELLGCGMVHPNVLRMSGIDPSVYSGFAFGMGLERIAMQRHAITDMRLLYENDVKFLCQF